MADLTASKHADEMREMWQGRVLARTLDEPLGAVVMSVLAHSYDDAMPVLLRVVIPNFEGIRPPFICSAAKIAKTGAIVADVATSIGTIAKDTVIARSSASLRSTFRRLADELKLADDDRRELFGAVQRWVVADRRLDPNMDPADPEAKRLVLH